MFDHPVIQYSLLIPLLPLLGAIIAGFFGARWLKGNSHWPIWIGVGIIAVLSIWLLASMLGAAHHAEGSTLSGFKNWFTWLEAGNFKANWGYFFDPLTAVMLCVVCGIGLLITIFAAGYMKGEEGYFRFFAYLGLFIFAMTVLVMGNNFVMLYLGWEGVGLCSYLLIGYYYERPAAREAAKKAFLLNRIGDFGFGVGIMLIFVIFGTVSFFGNGPGTNTGVLELASPGFQSFMGSLEPWKRQAIPWIPFLLMLGAFGKSAQFPLYVWLPDAMEGPTPVSALIHAATMVTAGVYLVARCAPLFALAPDAQVVVAWIGGITAVLAAFIALAQTDLKRVLAYSTVSQLGFMFLALGTSGAIDPAFAVGAAMFHLFTHAFFKALLFLSAGSVMHAMGGVIDVRKFGGLRKVMPITHLTFLCGAAALAGFPLLSGFWSKDLILESLTEASESKTNPYTAGYYVLFWVACFTALLTAFYTFRAYFLTFWGPERVPEEAGHHAHESPGSMTVPLIVLAVGAVGV